MTYITAVLMFVFGLSPSSDNLNYDVKYPDSDELLIVKDSSSKVVINTDDNEEYDPDNFNSGTPEDINNYN